MKTRLTAALVASTLSGCVAEVGLPALSTPVSSPPASDAAPPPEPLPQTLRLLSGAEYRETVRDLVGVELAATIDHRHLAAGYDTGANGTMQEGLLSTLLDEVERVAAVAVTDTLPSRFPCLDDEPTGGCVREVVTALSERALRRPATAAEVDDLVAFASSHGAVVGDARGGLAGAVARLLLSPGLLYRREVGARRGDGTFALRADEQASLVSYALTGAGPDEDLLATVAAADHDGAVIDEETLRDHARRLVDTPRGRARVAAMIRHWVKATALDDMVGRPADFPKLDDPAVARGLKDGFDAFVTDVAFSDDGSLAALLTSPFAMVNAHTAPLVGVDGVVGDDLQRVTLATTERRGLLTQPGLLAAHGASGEADKDRPVQRGFMIKTRLLCEPLGPPSGISTADAADAAAGIPGFDEMTTRDQYEAMMEQGPSCTACHAQFMPLGFAFGRYDALGRHRTAQRGQEVDASAFGVPFLGEVRDFADGLELSDALADAPAVAACFAENVAAFVTGQGTSPSTVALGRALAHADDGRAAVVDTLVAAVVRAATLPRVAVEGAIDDDAPADDAPAVDDAPGDDGTTGAEDPVDVIETLLASGEALQPRQQKTAHDGAFTLVYQQDGNVVLLEAGVPRWSSGTAGRPAHLAVMQGDGNFVVYARPGEPVFHTGTHGHAGAALALHQSGTLEVRAPDGRVLSAITSGGGAP